MGIVTQEQVRQVEELIVRAAITLRSVERSPAPKENNRVVWPEFVRGWEDDWSSSGKPLNLHNAACDVDVMDRVLSELNNTNISVLSRKIIFARLCRGRVKTWYGVAREIGRGPKFCKLDYDHSMCVVAKHFFWSLKPAILEQRRASGRRKLVSGRVLKHVKR